MRLDDAPIHPWAPAEIIGVYNKITLGISSVPALVE